ncbi:MAG: acyl-CoA dehydrogenase, partial [Actinomycetales bacterium]
MTDAAESLVLRALAELLPVREGESSVAFLRRQFDAGLAAVEHPVGLGGLGVSKHLQRVVDERLQVLG